MYRARYIESIINFYEFWFLRKDNIFWFRKNWDQSIYYYSANEAIAKSIYLSNIFPTKKINLIAFLSRSTSMFDCQTGEIALILKIKFEDFTVHYHRIGNLRKTPAEWFDESNIWLHGVTWVLNRWSLGFFFLLV